MGGGESRPSISLGGKMANIIIPGRAGRFGRTRSEQEKNLNKEGWYSLTEEKLDKCKYAEKRVRDKLGSSENFLSQTDIDKVK